MIRTGAVLGISKGVAIVHVILSCYPVLCHVGPVIGGGKALLMPDAELERSLP